MTNEFDPRVEAAISAFWAGLKWPDDWHGTQDRAYIRRCMKAALAAAEAIPRATVSTPETIQASEECDPNLDCPYCGGSGHVGDVSPILWAVHSIGPNEIWAMPDYDTAVKNAWALSRDPRLERDHPYKPEVFVVPILWPGTADEHADNLAKQGGAEKIKSTAISYFKYVMDEREAALSAPAPPSPWRPISKAPKDGTEILIVDACDEIFIVHYGGKKYKVEWWELQDGLGSVNSCQIQAWQPLPPLPNKEGV
jgi:hypothetical protein